ncbi:MAG: LPS-assembly protein LptD [Thermodesulfobacteria bacterium]|nr:LPS-assembly protein LptD [Thermodesulfobacteriota bacterium]
MMVQLLRRVDSVFFQAWLLVNILLLAPPCLEAKIAKGDTPWDIKAERLVFFHNSKVVIAEGSVEVKRGKLKVFADKIIYDEEAGKIYASGHVVIHLGQDVLKGAKGSLDLKTSTGQMEDAFLYLRRNNIHLTAKELEKTGPEEYHAVDATVSTCPMPDQDWRFRCRDLTLTVDGEAKGKNAFFEIKDIPVLFSPWIYVPINRYRKTGFLIPEYTSSKRNGIGIDVPFFLVLNDSMDLTFYQHPMSSRGWMEGVEYRHVFSQTDKAIVRYNFLNDKKDDNDFNGDGHVRGNEFRWWIRGKLNQALPFGFLGKLDVDLMSDMDYLQEFDTGLMGFTRSDETFKKWFHRNLAEDTDKIRPSVAQVTRETEELFLGFHGRYNDNHFFGQRGYTVQTLPSALLHSFKRPLWKRLLYYQFDFDYTDYWREQGTKEHRIRLNPSISTPVDLFDWADLVITGSLEDSIYVAYGEDDYDNNPDDTANKFRYSITGDLSKTFARNYGTSDSGTWRHYITPRISYIYTPYRSSRDIPTIDQRDLYPERNKIIFSLLSFVTGKRGMGQGRHSYSDLLRVKLQQSYNFHKEPTVLSAQNFKPRRLSDLYGEIDLTPFPDFWLRYDTKYNFYGDGFRNHNVRWRYVGYRGSTFDLDYRYHKLEDINELNFNMNAILTAAWSFRFHIKQDFKRNKQIESKYVIRYTSSCWAIEGKLKTDSDDTSILVNLELLGIGGWTSR